MISCGCTNQINKKDKRRRIREEKQDLFCAKQK
jgi:hypothetical protein